MKTLYHVSILWLAAFATACDSATAPKLAHPGVETLVLADAKAHTAATGTFTQTAIISLVVSQSGPNTILEQTSTGSVRGTLSGSYTDQLRVVIHPNGRFNAHFTIRCECTMAGGQGVLTLMASDRGELVSPSLASFQGRAAITGGTADLADLRGVLRIEGTIDLASGLSTYAYSGSLH